MLKNSSTLLLITLAYLVARWPLKVWGNWKKNYRAHQQRKLYYALLHAEHAPLKQTQLDYEAECAVAINRHDTHIYQAELDYKKETREAYREHEDAHAADGISEKERVDIDNEYVWRKEVARDQQQKQLNDARKFFFSIEAEAREKRQLAIDTYLTQHPEFIREVLSYKRK